MAVIIGEIYRGREVPSCSVRVFAGLLRRLRVMLPNPRNPSSFPDRVWHRHSALLDAGKRSRSPRS